MILQQGEKGGWTLSTLAEAGWQFLSAVRGRRVQKSGRPGPVMPQQSGKAVGGVGVDKLGRRF